MTPSRHPEQGSDHFTSDEERRIARDIGDGSEPVCPRCGTSLDEWSVAPRPDVSYVRSRLWLVCPSCHRSLVLDRRHPGRD